MAIEKKIIINYENINLHNTMDILINKKIKLCKNNLEMF